MVGIPNIFLFLFLPEKKVAGVVLVQKGIQIDTIYYISEINNYTIHIHICIYIYICTIYICTI